MKKRWVRIGIAAMALVVVLTFLLPLLVNADRFRPMLQSELTQALGRPVTLGRLSFSLWKGSVEASDLAVADDPAFSSQPFLKAKRLAVGVEVWPLLLHGQLHVTGLTVEAPEIQLIETEQGAWNFSSLGGATSEPSGGGAAVPKELTVEQLKIKNGSAKLSTLGQDHPPFAYTGIEFSVEQFSFEKAFFFVLKAELPAKGAVELKGELGPLAMGEMMATPFQAELTVERFDPVESGVIARSAGVSMLLDVKARMASDGKTVSTQGGIQAHRLHLAKTGAPARQTVAADFHSALDLTSRAGEVKELTIHAGQAAARLQGSFNLIEKGADLDLRLSAPNLPIDQLQELLPAAGVSLPQGSRLTGGTLSASLTIQGPVNGLTIAGPVSVDNTRLAGFDIGSQLQGMNPFGSKGSGTSIQTLRAQLRSTPARTELHEIYANLPQVGTASGNGYVTASEELNFDLTANFDPATGIGALTTKAVQSGMNSLMSRLGGFGKSLIKPKANGAIPVSVTGTATHPKIRVRLKEIF